MNGYLENQFSMMRTVQGVGRKAAPVLSTIPALWGNFQLFDTKIDWIEDYIQNQIKPIEGITIDKQNARKKLIGRVLLASGIVRSYADNNHNNQLAYQVKVTRSGLLRMRDEIMYDAAKVVIDTAADLQAHLGAYGLTPQMLITMQDALTNYHELIEATTEAKTNRKHYTHELYVTMKEAMDLLRNNIDGHMEVLMDTHPAIVGKFRNARMIYDYSSGRRKKVIEDENVAVISGTVTDADGFGVADVKVIVENTGISTTTDIDGEYLIDTLPAGKYNLIVSLEGYKETRENDFSVVAGDDVVKDFVIEAE